MQSLELYDLTKTSPIKAIKEFCRVCNGEVKGGNKYDCLDRNCVLYPFKEGKGNYEKDIGISQEHKNYIKSLGSNKVRKARVMSEEQRQKNSERMKRAWETRRAKES